MTRPFVAVTTFWLDRAGRHGQPQAGIYGVYISALDMVDVTPVLITPLHAASSVNALLDACSGLVLTGGGDVHPARYGEAPIPELGYVSEEQDALEWALLDRSLERGIPILGICRGVQVLNVYFGGTLYQDLPVQLGSAVRHDQTQPWGSPSHEITVQPGSKLHAIVGRERYAVSSHHHQAVKDVAPGLDVTARTDDGVIEALEAASYPWLVGVEWHPERHPADAPQDDPDRRLLAAFRNAALAHTSSQ